jgi:hypothetical protein
MAGKRFLSLPLALSGHKAHKVSRGFKASRVLPEPQVLQVHKVKLERPALLAHRVKSALLAHKATKVSKVIQG